MSARCIRLTVEAHLLGRRLDRPLGRVIWCGDVIGQVEVDLIAVDGRAEVRLVQLHWSRAEWGAGKSQMSRNGSNWNPKQGNVPYLSKTSRLSASFVLVGVLRDFWRNSTFFFKLYGTKRMRGKTRESSDSHAPRQFCCRALPLSLGPHWRDRFAGTSCPLSFDWLPPRLFASKWHAQNETELRSTATRKQRSQLLTWQIEDAASPCSWRWALLSAVSRTCR